MAQTLFFLHIPKCAGMSLSYALLDLLPANEVYQSTSMVRNYWDNRPEFLLLPEPSKLRAVAGHWICDEMLPALARPLFFATSVREPVARMRSQFRFDMRLREGTWPASGVTEFLEKNRNPMCWFLTTAFPSISADYATPLAGAKAVLSAMDCVFDVTDADVVQPKLLQVIGLNVERVARVNESQGVPVELPASDFEIRNYCDDDIRLYEWFVTEKSRGRASLVGNPVFDQEQRSRLAQKAATPFSSQRVAEFMAGKLAAELLFGTGDASRARSYVEGLQNSANALSEAFTSLTS